MRKDSLDRRRRPELWLWAGLLLAAMALLAVLNSKITVYSDDYWYGTFYDNGIRGFLRNMRRAFDANAAL